MTLVFKRIVPEVTINLFIDNEGSTWVDPTDEMIQKYGLTPKENPLLTFNTQELYDEWKRTEFPELQFNVLTDSEIPTLPVVEPIK